MSTDSVQKIILIFFFFRKLASDRQQDIKTSIFVITCFLQGPRVLVNIKCVCVLHCSRLLKQTGERKEISLMTWTRLMVHDLFKECFLILLGTKKKKNSLSLSRRKRPLEPKRTMLQTATSNTRERSPQREY